VDNPIFIKYKWTADELLTAQRLHLRHSRGGRAYRVMKICGPVAIPAGIVIMLQIGFHWAECIWLP